MQYTSNPNQFIQFSSTTGKYIYRDCGKNITIEGTGTVSQSFCKIQLTDSGPDPKRPDRSINLLVNPCTMRGDATIRMPANKLIATIGDTDITNNTCACP